ncbi:MAG TPA: peptidoglycan-binding protein [Candidatus Paceibacterota bacterium]|nr:peptidoglycan-binding protein [Candidatus Paceibacterota bacterium]
MHMYRTSWFKFAAYLVSAGMVLSLAPAVASAAGLTDAQVSSVVSLLQSFGVDSSVIARVEATLSGKASPGDSHENDSDHRGVPPTVCHCPMIPAGGAPATASTTSGGCACGGMATSSPAFICRAPHTDLDRGAKGDDVSELQTTLGVEATGFFGPLTHAAVMKWQSENGLPSTGYVGSMTRAKLIERCGKPVPMPGKNPVSLSASPSSGVAPLTVAFSTSGGSTGTYIISFGDGATSSPLKAECAATATVGSVPTCSVPSASHTYTAAGTYQATLSPYVACMYSNPRCMIAVMLLASTTISVLASSTAQ